MRISELSAATGVSVASIKYYLREGLLPEGERTSATQAAYGDVHVRRLGVIRALVDSGVGIAATRDVLAAIDAPGESINDLLGTAHGAVMPDVAAEADLTAAENVARRVGWTPGSCDEQVLAGLDKALRNLERADFDLSDEVLDAYASATQRIAAAELAGVPTTSPEAAVRYVVLGSVLMEPVLLALRRVAEQVASERRFGKGAG